MYKSNASERLSNKATIARVKRPSFVCEDNSGSSSTAQNDNNQEILKLLRAIHQNGERQIKLLEAVVGGANDVKEKQVYKEQRALALEKKPNLVHEPSPTSVPWTESPDEAAAPDLFTSSEEDRKLSMVIILGILRVAPSLMDRLNVTEQTWSFLLHHQHAVATWTPKPATEPYETAKGARIRRLTDFIREFRSSLARRGLPEVVLKRNGTSIRLRFPENEAQISEMGPDLAQYIILRWLKRPDFSLLPYVENHKSISLGVFKRMCRVGTGPIRMTDNLFHFQQMALVMEFMAIQAPRGPVVSNIQAAWDFTLDFVAPWKSRGQLPCSRQNAFWVSPKDPSQRVRLETLTLQHFMRVFSTIREVSVNADAVKRLELGGVLMSRTAGGLERTRVNKAHQPLFRRLELTEKRLGQMMVVSINYEVPVYKMIRLADSAVGISTPEPEVVKADTEYGPHRWQGGITIFQEAILANFATWYQEWEETMYHIDAVLKVQLEDIFDPTTRMHLMFESSSNSKFEQSETYFFVIELLRIASDWITEAVTDLHTLRTWTTRLVSGPDDITALIEAKWEEVFDVAKKHEANLLARIEKQRLEVYSLRDGLFNATSVRESTKGTHINEYILVFTVMTVLYLPLGFMATLYGIDLFDFKVPGQTKQFAITTGLVAGSTYLAALGLLYGVRHRRKKGSYRELWAGVMQETATSLGTALFQFKGAFGAQQTEAKAEEVLVQDGIPEHLKRSFFADYGQEMGNTVEQQPDEQRQHHIWARDIISRRGTNTRISV
ncbi:hypothetical protein PG991_001817 [Apiospora marii]|uniref:Magnesium transporter n=1 Tax=Apiospora marii TaxID=335849 RepID=A0ABR1SN58_9PEZI